MPTRLEEFERMSAVGTRAVTKSRACGKSEEVSLSQSDRLPPFKADRIRLHHIIDCVFRAAEFSFCARLPESLLT